MTSLAALTRISCHTCGVDTLHRGVHCVHCGSVFAAQVLRIDVETGIGAWRNGVQRTAEQIEQMRRKPGRPRKSVQHLMIAQEVATQSGRPCARCKVAPRESRSYCKPCRKADSAEYYLQRRKVTA